MKSVKLKYVPPFTGHFLIKKTLLLFLPILLFSCGRSNEKKLRIATAASAQFVLEELGEKFGKKHGVTVDVITSSSGKLATQILNSAPFDIFFAANMRYPEEVEAGGKSESEPQVYGYGLPVFWTLEDYIELDVNGKFLLDDRVNKIAIANPKTAPYGEKAVDYLKAIGLYDQVEPKLVYGESISQVNEYVQNRTVQVGISAKSIVLSPGIEEKGHFLELGDAYRIEQGCVVLSNTGENDLKQKFIDYVFSDEGRAVFAEFGYGL